MSLGKVHLTKRMQQEREMILGVKKPATHNNKALKTTSKDGQGNDSLQQAWNTSGFLPQSINPGGQKNSVKDFEYLKFLNDTILKDDVLDKFMQKAGEIEQAAGPKIAHSNSPKKKQNEAAMTPLERFKFEFKRNPHRFHTCTRFESFFQKQTQKRSMTKQAGDKDEHSNRQSHAKPCEYRNAERHRTCRGHEQSHSHANSNSRSPSKHAQLRNANSINTQGQQHSTMQQQTMTSLTKRNHTAFGSSQPRMSQHQGESNDMQPGKKIAGIKKKIKFRSRRNSTEMMTDAGKNPKHRQQQQKTLISSQSHLSPRQAKPNTAAGLTRKRKSIKHIRAVSQEGKFELIPSENDEQIVLEMKRATQAMKQASVAYEGSKQIVDLARQKKLSTYSEQYQRFNSNSNQHEALSSGPGGYADKKALISLQTQQEVALHHGQTRAFTQTNTQQMLSPRVGAAKSVTSKQKLITNITGKPSDKLKLTKRLNDAVDDLIKMGQKYQEKSKMIAKQIPLSRDFTSAQPSLDSNAIAKTSKVSSIHDVLSSTKFNKNKITQRSNLPSQSGPESFLISAKEIGSNGFIEEPLERSRQTSDLEKSKQKQRQRCSKHEIGRLVQSSCDSALQHVLVKRRNGLMQDETGENIVGEKMVIQTRLTPDITKHVSVSPDLIVDHLASRRQNKSYASFDAFSAQIQQIHTQENTTLDPIVSKSRNMGATMQQTQQNSQIAGRERRYKLRQSRERQRSEDDILPLNSYSKITHKQGPAGACAAVYRDEKQSSHCSLKSSTRMGQNGAVIGSRCESSQNLLKKQTKVTNEPKAISKLTSSSQEQVSQDTPKKQHQKQTSINCRKYQARDRKKSVTKAPSTQENQLLSSESLLNRKSQQQCTRLQHNESQSGNQVDSSTGPDAAPVPENLHEKLNQVFCNRIKNRIAAATSRTTQDQQKVYFGRSVTATSQANHARCSPAKDSPAQASQQKLPTYSRGENQSTQLRYKSKPRQQVAPIVAHSTGQVSEGQSDPATFLSANKLIQKDEAIEMIQTGPREHFSSVLRYYLSSQQQMQRQQQVQMLPMKETYSSHLDKANCLEREKKQHPVPASDFTRAQQHLLAKQEEQLPDKMNPSILFSSSINNQRNDNDLNRANSTTKTQATISRVQTTSGVTTAGKVNRLRGHNNRGILSVGRPPVRQFTQNQKPSQDFGALSNLSSSMEKDSSIANYEHAIQQNSMRAYMDQMAYGRNKNLSGNTTESGQASHLYMKHKQAVVRNIQKDENQRRVLNLQHAYKSRSNSRNQTEITSRNKMQEIEENGGRIEAVLSVGEERSTNVRALSNLRNQETHKRQQHTYFANKLACHYANAIPPRAHSYQQEAGGPQDATSQRCIRNIIIERQQKQIQAFKKQETCMLKQMANSRNEVQKGHSQTNTMPLSQPVAFIDTSIGFNTAAQRSVTNEEQNAMLSEKKKILQQLRAESRQKRRNILISDDKKA